MNTYYIIHLYNKIFRIFFIYLLENFESALFYLKPSHFLKTLITISQISNKKTNQTTPKKQHNDSKNNDKPRKPEHNKIFNKPMPYVDLQERFSVRNGTVNSDRICSPLSWFLGFRPWNMYGKLNYGACRRLQRNASLKFWPFRSANGVWIEVVAVFYICFGDGME